MGAATDGDVVAATARDTKPGVDAAKPSALAPLNNSRRFMPVSLMIVSFISATSCSDAQGENAAGASGITK